MVMTRTSESKLMANSMSWLEFSASKCDKSLSFNKAWTDCVFFNRQINKEIAVCIHRGVLFIHKEG